MTDTSILNLSPSGIRRSGRRRSWVALVYGGDPKSQTKSQREQTPGHARPLPATIVAARYHVRPLPAPSSHATDFAYKRGVRRFKSYCAHFFRISVGVSRRKSRSRTSRRYILSVWGQELCGAWMPRAKNHVCSHPGPRWGLHDSHEHGESQGVQPPPRASRVIGVPKGSRTLSGFGRIGRILLHCSAWYPQRMCASLTRSTRFLPTMPARLVPRSPASWWGLYGSGCVCRPIWASCSSRR